MAKEVKNLIREFNLPDITKEEINLKISKPKWKKIVKDVLREKCKFELQSKMKKLSKLENSDMANETFKAKDYLKNMDMEDARTKFKIRTEMLNFKFNYKNDYQNRASLWNCDSCQTSIETQTHILWCPSYSELREGKNLLLSSSTIRLNHLLRQGMPCT